MSMNVSLKTIAMPMHSVQTRCPPIHALASQVMKEMVLSVQKNQKVSILMNTL